MGHPSIMMRRAFLVRHDLTYREEYRHVEDYDLYLRAAALGDLANLQEILVLSRAHEREISAIHEQEQRRTEARLRAEQLKMLMPDATAEELIFHTTMLEEALPASALRRADRWLVRLGEANRVAGRYDAGLFTDELRELFYRLHVNARTLGVADVMAFCVSPLARRQAGRAFSTVDLFVRALGRLVRRALRGARRRLSQQGGAASGPEV